MIPVQDIKVAISVTMTTRPTITKGNDKTSDNANDNYNHEDN